MITVFGFVHLELGVNDTKSKKFKGFDWYLSCSVLQSARDIESKMRNETRLKLFTLDPDLQVQQISILELILKDHVTLKTGVMMLKIQLCITGIETLFFFLNVLTPNYRMVVYKNMSIDESHELILHRNWISLGSSQMWSPLRKSLGSESWWTVTTYPSTCRAVWRKMKRGQPLMYFTSLHIVSSHFHHSKPTSESFLVCIAGRALLCLSVIVWYSKWTQDLLRLPCGYEPSVCESAAAPVRSSQQHHSARQSTRSSTDSQQPDRERHSVSTTGEDTNQEIQSLSTATVTCCWFIPQMKGIYSITGTDTV